MNYGVCSAFDSLLCNGTVQKPVSGITAIKAKLNEVELQEAEAIDLGGDDGIVHLYSLV